MSASSMLRRKSIRGQAMVEFGLVVGLFLLVIGGLVQFGIIFWTQNAITQVSRDTARFAVTLSNSPCDPAARAPIAAAANELARSASLVNYRTGAWTTASSIASLGPEGVGVDWLLPPDGAGVVYTDDDCPPSDNRIAVDVRVRINHVVPIFFPGLQLFAPPCGTDGFCLTSEAQLRMEPKKR